MLFLACKITEVTFYPLLRMFSTATQDRVSRLLCPCTYCLLLLDRNLLATVRVASILARPQKVATVLLGILVVSATVLLSSGVLHSSDNLNASYDRLAPVRYASQKILKHLHIAYSDELTVKWDGKVGDKVIVMAHTSQEDVSWVKEKLPEYVIKPRMGRIAPPCAIALSP